MKDKIFSVLQRVGRSFMLPIAILPVAGLLLGIGSSFTNATTIETYGLTKILGEGTLLHSLLVIMNSVGAGDSMVAGFVAGYQQSGGDYEAALRLGTACGSATAFSLGLATKADIDKLLKTME